MERALIIRQRWRGRRGEGETERQRDRERQREREREKGRKRIGMKRIRLAGCVDSERKGVAKPRMKFLDSCT